MASEYFLQSCGPFPYCPVTRFAKAYFVSDPPTRGGSQRGFDKWYSRVTALGSMTLNVSITPESSLELL